MDISPAAGPPTGPTSRPPADEGHPRVAEARRLVEQSVRRPPAEALEALEAAAGLLAAALETPPSTPPSSGPGQRPGGPRG